MASRSVKSFGPNKLLINRGAHHYEQTAVLFEYMHQAYHGFGRLANLFPGEPGMAGIAWRNYATDTPSVSGMPLLSWHC